MSSCSHFNSRAPAISKVATTRIRQDGHKSTQEQTIIKCLYIIPDIAQFTTLNVPGRWIDVGKHYFAIQSWVAYIAVTWNERTASDRANWHHPASQLQLMAETCNCLPHEECAACANQQHRYTVDISDVSQLNVARDITDLWMAELTLLPNLPFSNGSIHECNK
jgi:sucrose-6-phosphate hydrolase SacC (GH32 family)